MAPRVAIGSLNKMVTSVKEKKAVVGLNAVGNSQNASSKKFAQDSSSSGSSDDTSSSGSESESDSDDDLDAAKKKLDAKMASKKKGSETKVNGTKPQTHPSHKPAKAAVKPEPESESESESDSESEDESEPVSAPSNKAAPKPNVPAKTANADESETTSDSEDSSSESEEEEQTGAKVNTQNQEAAKAQNGRADESGSDESSGSSESDSEEQGENNAVARVNGDAALSRSNWLNNSDFTLRKASSDNPGKEVSDFFSKTNLEGKQVWYFTAPSSLPITVIKEMEIDLAKATAGNPILNHQGDNYGLDLEANATNTQIQLLIPSKGGDKYNALNRGIDSTVHLRRMAQFGPGGTVSSTASDEYVPRPKGVREQPQGLRARFTPIGVAAPQLAKPSSIATHAKSTAKPATQDASESSDSESESESDSDEEMADAPAPSLPTTSTPSKKSEAHVANSKLKRKQPADEQKLPPSPAKEPASSEQSSKRHKSVKSASGADTTKIPASTPTGASKSKVSSSQASKLASVKKETPIAAPNLALLASSASAPADTPSKAAKSKDKKEKKEKKSRKDSTPRSSATEVKRTPIPPPSIPGMK